MPHSSIPNAGEPVERGHEQPVHHAPHAAHAAGKGGAARIDWVTGTCPGTEGGERLKELSERATAEKIVVLFFDLTGDDVTDDDHYGEVTSDNDIIECNHGGSQAVYGVSGCRGVGSARSAIVRGVVPRAKKISGLEFGL